MLYGHFYLIIGIINCKILFTINGELILVYHLNSTFVVSYKSPYHNRTCNSRLKLSQLLLSCYA